MEKIKLKDYEEVTTDKNTEKNYLVSYSFGDNNNFGLGYMSFTTSSKITQDFIKLIVEEIEKKCRNKKIVIINIINLDNL